MQGKAGYGVALGLLAWTALGRAQTACFRSVAEAVRGEGRLAADGFQLEGTLRDRMNGERWAQVGRCGHPEWPALLVKAPAPETAGVAKVRLPGIKEPDRSSIQPTPERPAAKVSVPAEEPAVRAGQTVTVSERSALVHLEVAGVALSNAQVGDRVRCRVGNQQFVVGTVKDRGLVEIQ